MFRHKTVCHKDYSFVAMKKIQLRCAMVLILLPSSTGTSFSTSFRASSLTRAELPKRAFDRAKFLCKRITIADTLAVVGRDNLVPLAQLISSLQRVRLVLIVCWIRWVLNRLPTANRLQSGGFADCPYCGEPNVKCDHLLLRFRLFHIAPATPCCSFSGTQFSPSDFHSRELMLMV